jgi:hypothetical protein
MAIGSVSSSHGKLDEVHMSVVLSFDMSDQILWGYKSSDNVEIIVERVIGWFQPHKARFKPRISIRPKRQT